MVTLPMPPMFCSARHESPANSSASAMGTSGAPCPPAATSRTRKSLTTSTPVRSAITADSPICQVACGGACQSVCPCEAMARISSRGTPASAITATAASASQPPRSNCSTQYSSAVPTDIARCRASRWLAVYSITLKAHISGSKPVSRGWKRTATAVIPSSDVPDMSPT